MPRSPLTEIVNHVNDMIDHVRTNLDDQEYDLFLDLINPEPERVVEKVKPRKPKKIPHCNLCDYTKRHQVHKDSSRSDYHVFEKPSSSSKSKRARSIGDAIQKTPKIKTDDDSTITKCQFLLDDNTGEKCEAVEDDPIHDLAYSSSHEFDSGKSHALAAGGGL